MSDCVKVVAIEQLPAYVCLCVLLCVCVLVHVVHAFSFAVIMKVSNVGLGFKWDLLY